MHNQETHLHVQQQMSRHIKFDPNASQRYWTPKKAPHQHKTTRCTMYSHYYGYNFSNNNNKTKKWNRFVCTWKSLVIVEQKKKRVPSCHLERLTFTACTPSLPFVERVICYHENHYYRENLKAGKAWGYCFAFQSNTHIQWHHSPMWKKTSKFNNEREKSKNNNKNKSET